MAKGFKRGAGGGNPLNFKVIAYATEEERNAATPKENTIGVITDTDITSWAFIATEPEEPEAGMMWFSVGSTSSIEFNILKKNAIHIYPLYASQYVGGQWVEREAFTYRNGEWTQWWDGTLFANGDTYDLQTGGWEALPFPERYPGTGQAPGLSISSDGITVSLFTGSTNIGGKAQTKKAIDFAPYSVLTVRYDSVVAGTWSGNEFRLYSATTGAEVLFKGCQYKSNVEENIDISSVNEKCFLAIGVGVASNTGGDRHSIITLKYARLLR